MSETMSLITTEHNDSNLFASMHQDVLLIIFGEAIYRNANAGNALSNSFPLWRFGQVCAHWRRTLKSHPVIWSHISTTFWEFPNVRACVLESRFRNLIQLSGMCVLHVSVWMAATSTRELGDVIARALRDVAGRIGELKISFANYSQPSSIDRANLPLPLLQSELLTNCVFPALHTLSISIPFSQVRLLGDAGIRVDAFAQCPLLQRVYLQEETHRVEFVLPYQNLTTIYANGGRFDYIINKLAHPTDVTLDLSPISDRLPAISLHSAPIWRSAALETLKTVRFECYFLFMPFVSFSSIFSSLHARALRKLELGGMCRELIEIFAIIPDIALGGLEELVVGCMRITPEYVDGQVQTFIDLMARMPALRSLDISHRFGHYVLGALAEGNDLVPALTVLKIRPDLLREECEKVVCFARDSRRETLNVEVGVSLSAAYHGRVEGFLPDILASDAAGLWEELVSLAKVHVV